LVYALVDGLDVRYVGYTARPERRRKAHARRHPDWHWLVLGSYASASDGLERERWWIKRLHDMGHPLTNISDGGTPGYFLGRHSMLTRERFSKAHLGQPAWNKGVPNSPEARRKISMALKGKKHSAETKAKMSIAHKGKQHALGHRHSEATRLKMSAAHKGNQYSLGRRHSAETKAKMSLAKRGRAPSPQCIAASIRAQTGRPKSAETRAKISATKQGRSLTPEHRAKLSVASMGHPYYPRRAK